MMGELWLTYEIKALYVVIVVCRPTADEDLAKSVCQIRIVCISSSTCGRTSL